MEITKSSPDARRRSRNNPKGTKRTCKAQYCHWDQDGNSRSHLQDGIIFFEDEGRRFENSSCARSKAFTVAAARSFGTSPAAECVSFAIWKPSGACTAAVQQLAASLAQAAATNQARLHRQQSERCRCCAGMLIALMGLEHIQNTDRVVGCYFCLAKVCPYLRILSEPTGVAAQISGPYCL